RAAGAVLQRRADPPFRPAAALAAAAGARLPPGLIARFLVRGRALADPWPIESFRLRHGVPPARSGRRQKERAARPRLGAATTSSPVGLASRPREVPSGAAL